MNDRGFKRALDRLVPYPDSWEAWRKLEERVEKRKKRRRIMKVALAPAVIFLVLLTVTYYAASGPFAKSPLIVISDGVSPAGGSEISLPDAGNLPTDPAEAEIRGEAESLPYLAALAAAWADKGIPVVAVESSGNKPWEITVKVPREAVAPPKGMFLCNRLIRTAFLRRLQDNLPLDRMAIVSLDPVLGEQAHYGPISLENGFMVQPEWQLSADLDESSARTQVEALIEATQSKAEMSVPTRYEVLFGDRTVTVEATLTPRDWGAFREYVADLLTGLSHLNKEQGTHVAVVTVEASGADGESLVRGLWDFMTGVQGWSGEADLMPPWWGEG